MIKSLREAPPSTESVSIFTPASRSMERSTSKLWYAIDSHAARTSVARSLAPVKPQIRPRASGSHLSLIHIWFQLFELQAFEEFSYTKDNFYASFDLADVQLTARVGDGTFKTTDGAVTLPTKGDVFALDPGSIRRDIKVANLDQQTLSSAEAVYSLSLIHI